MLPARASRNTEDADSAAPIEVHGDCFAAKDAFSLGLTEFSESHDHRRITGQTGCYSVVVRQSGETTLFADPVGQFPLFYDEAGQYSTRSGELGTVVDRVYLATRLACLDGAGLFENRSLYEGVRRVREGHALHIGAGVLDERPYAPLRTDPDLSDATAADMLRDALVGAVSARARSARRLVADFSGGLDSTSLAHLAVAEVSDLPVFTHHNTAFPVLDDVERADLYAGADRRFDQRHVDVPAEHLPYQDLAPVGDEPHAASIACGPARLRFAAAAALGADVHLMGEGGDAVLWAPGAYFIDLARRGDLATLWRHCLAWARLRNRSPLTVFRRAVVMAGLGRRRALLRLADTLERGRVTGDLAWEVSVVARWDAPQVQWYTPSTRQLLAAQARRVAEQESDVDAGESVVLTQLRLHGLTQQVHRVIGLAAGVSVQAPFLDTAVVRAAMAIPAHRRADPAVAKPLLKKALTGLVPDRVLARETKGDYSREAYQGIKRAAPFVRKLLADSAAADFKLIDPIPVRQTLEDAVNGLRVPWGALNQVLAVEVWLRAHEREVAST
ncbi:asparagine synthase-related protein [Lentzea cavernae]|uniref:asparagine synthase (glutamine-hydrolyzing) n=1 Tax=Lentzea cavernae TaxID=2020703 RepID=A0ABQ3MKF7_9PSEU|nr:asparagine synthase-related protein [Lentzea cavernae]GHH50776.1 asparagine synthase [Lentzea cavernae]